jgi:hypothetical protein
MLITNSRLRAFRRCPRYHQHAYVDLVRPVEQSYALRFGTLIHLALESWWLNPTCRLTAAMHAIEAACANDEFDEFDHIKAEELIRGYHARWSDDTYETISVEQEFQIPIENGHTLGGKFDALARKDGKTYIIEHKTTSESLEPGGDYYQRVCTLDSQVSTYYRAAKALSHDISGCVYDCILRIALRPYKAGKTRKNDETPEEFRLRVRAAIADEPEKFYARYGIVRTERDETEAASDLRRTIRHLEIAVEEGSYRNTESCKSFGSTCSYIGVCSGTESLENTLKFRRAEQANEELTVDAVA